MQKFIGKIVENQILTDKVRYVKIEHQEPNVLQFQAGQYITVMIDKGILRAYSIATDDQETKYIETYVDISPGGPGSIFFKHAKVGQLVTYMAPGGRFVYENNNRPSIFICTGTGVVPFLSMVKKALKTTKNKIYLLQGVRFKVDAFALGEIVELDKQSEEFKFEITLSKEGAEGYKFGRVTTHIDAIIQEYGLDVDVYICGIKEMIKDVEASFLQRGIEKDRIKYEKYN